MNTGRHLLYASTVTRVFIVRNTPKIPETEKIVLCPNCRNRRPNWTVVARARTSMALNKRGWDKDSLRRMANARKSELRYAPIYVLGEWGHVSSHPYSAQGIGEFLVGCGSPHLAISIHERILRLFVGPQSGNTGGRSSSPSTP